MDSKTRNAVMIFKALGDENRIKILDTLRTGEKCACSILEKLAIVQSTLSHHMKILCDCGIVEGREEGKWTYYSLCPEKCGQALDLLNKLSVPTVTAAEKEHCR
jgi:ArsR family transcriptional regulator